MKVILLRLIAVCAVILSQGTYTMERCSALSLQEQAEVNIRKINFNDAVERNDSERIAITFSDLYEIISIYLQDAYNDTSIQAIAYQELELMRVKVSSILTNIIAYAESTNQPELLECLQPMFTGLQEEVQLVDAIMFIKKHQRTAQVHSTLDEDTQMRLALAQSLTDVQPVHVTTTTTTTAALAPSFVAQAPMPQAYVPVRVTTTTAGAPQSPVGMHGLLKRQAQDAARRVAFAQPVATTVTTTVAPTETTQVIAQEDADIIRKHREDVATVLTNLIAQKKDMQAIVQCVLILKEPAHADLFKKAVDVVIAHARATKNHTILGDLKQQLDFISPLYAQVDALHRQLLIELPSNTSGTQVRDVQDLVTQPGTWLGVIAKGTAVTATCAAIGASVWWYVNNR